MILWVLIGAGSYHLQKYIVTEHRGHIQIVSYFSGYNMQEYVVSQQRRQQYNFYHSEIPKFYECMFTSTPRKWTIIWGSDRELVLNPRSKQNSDSYIHITNSAPM